MNRLLSKEFQYTYEQAFTDAKNKGLKKLSVEHLLLFLLNDEQVQQALNACGTHIQSLRQDLMGYPTTQHQHTSDDAKVIKPDQALQRIIQKAAFTAQLNGNENVACINVVVAIFAERSSQAAILLKKHGITRVFLLNHVRAQGEVNSLAGKISPNSFSEPFTHGEIDIADYCINLNQKMRAGATDPLIGRDLELQRVMQILSRRKKNNPLLIGEPGVGKTAIAKSLAHSIIQKSTPAALANSTVYSLDIGSLLAGTKYRGEFEARLKKMLDHLAKQENAILFIDEIHTMVGAGAVADNTLDAANMLKPLLTDGSLRCIGATTYQEYRNTFQNDKALLRRYQVVEVKEPSKEQAVAILAGIRAELEQYHGVQFNQEALVAAVELSDKYITDRFLPDKAIDIIDEAGAYAKLNANTNTVVNANDICEVISTMTKIPLARLSSSAKESLYKLADNMKSKIFGQDEAIDKITTAIKLAHSGLKDLRSPIGSFVFAGPTGVGKTEVSRELADMLGVELIRIDMSEYMEKHTVSRLIGSPPGYVGHNQGGILTDLVHQHPYCVLLLDEIEKAHPDIYNILLQVMDNGVLTDANGQEISFRNTIMILTTNVGANALEKNQLGFQHRSNEIVNDRNSAIKQLFSPEFRNRLDHVIHFSPLAEDKVSKVLDKFIEDLQMQLKQKNIILEVDVAAREWLSLRGYDAKLGARPMKRILQQQLKEQLAEEILFGSLQHGGSVKITLPVNAKSLQFTFSTSQHDEL